MNGGPETATSFSLSVQLSDQAEVASFAQSLIRNDKNPKALLDCQLRILVASSDFAGITGLGVKEHPGRNIRELMPFLGGGFGRLCEGLLQEGSAPGEHSYLSDPIQINGQTRQWLVHLVPIFTPEGKHAAIALVLRELSPGSHVAPLMAQLLEHFGGVVGRLPIGVFCGPWDGESVWWSEGMYAHHAVSFSRACPSWAEHRELLDPADRHLLSAEWPPGEVSRAFRSCHYRMVGATESHCGFDMEVAVVPDPDGIAHVIGIVEASQDVGEVEGGVSGSSPASDALRARLREQEAVAQLGFDALRINDEDEVLGLAVQMVRQVLRTELSCIFQHVDSDSLLLRKWSGWEESLEKGRIIPLSLHPMASHVLYRHQSVVVDAASEEDRFTIPPMLRAQGVVGGISVDIPGSGAPFGTLEVHSRTPQIFPREAVTFLQSVATLLGAFLSRKRAEAALCRSEENITAILEAEPACVKLMTKEGVLCYMNRAGLDLVEAETLSQVQGRSLCRGHRDYVPVVLSDYSDCFEESIQRALQGETTQIQFRISGLRGTTRWMESTVAPFSQNEEDDILVLAITQDISEKKEAELQLQRETTFSETLLTSLPGVLFLIDEDGALQRWNRALVAETGYSPLELRSMTVLDLIPAEERSAFRGTIQSAFLHGRSSIEGHLQSERSENTPYLFSGTVLTLDARRYCLWIGIDMSDRKQLEEEYRQAQKMEAVGQLAGGVAHDLNNLLTIIAGYSEIMLSTLSEDQGHYGPVQAIRDAGERATSLTRQLLAFSRKQVLEPRVLNLNAVLKDFQNMLRRLIGEDVILTTLLDARAPSVHVDPGQMEQVILNLAVNARDAMPQGGSLTLSTKAMEGKKSRSEQSGASFLVLEVSDTGCGMTPEVKERIFEPFFTTKGAGRGTGLGLATVYGIVKQSGGSIAVTSQPGAGTTFRIYFPGVDDQPVASSARRKEMAPTGSETILLVEDEDGVRSLAQHALESFGYTVMVASCGDEALTVASEVDGVIALLVTDVVMPRMNGRELADRLSERSPNLKVLFMSGYTDDSILRNGIREKQDHFLHKPFTPAALASKVREVLDQ